MTSLPTQINEIRPDSDSGLPPRSESAPQTAESDSNANATHSIIKDETGDRNWATSGLVREHVRTRRLIWIGLMLVALCAAWCFWPLSSPEITAPTSSLAPAPPPASTTFDSKPFDSMIWSLAALPPPPAAPPAPPPAVKVQLIAITQSAGKYQATLYDPDFDKLMTVREGDIAGDRTVSKITKATVTLSFTSHNQTSPAHHHILALDTAATETGGKR